MEEIDIKDNLFEHFSFSVDPGQDPLRIDKFLMNRIENASRNKIQIAAKNNCILVDGNPVKPNYKVKPGNEIKIMFSYPPYETAVTWRVAVLGQIAKLKKTKRCSD